MNPYSLRHLSNETLDRELVASAFKECDATAVVLARIAESDSRKRYAAVGYTSMAAYCVATIPHLCESEAAAYNRIHAARTARDYPAIFAMVADGRLSLTAVNLLAPYLTPDNADELLSAAAHQTKAALLQLLAARFPRPDVPTLIQPVPATLSGNHSFQNEWLPENSESHDGGSSLIPAPVPPPRIAPLSAERYELRATIDREAHDLLRHVQALLGRPAASHVPEVLKHALRYYARHLEKRKFGATDRPRPGRSLARSGSRHIPAQVRRAVWERDGNQCTFVSQTGHRCEARTRLEFDHILEVARGGESTAGNLRLRCRAHNQYEADRTFGLEFMNNKRERARRAAADKHAEGARTETNNGAAAAGEDPDHDVTPWLRSLGFRADQARRAAEFCATLPADSLEARVRAAVSFLGRRPARFTGASAPGA